MSGILECPGVFQVPLVDGWTVSGTPGESYDISHTSSDVGVNISVYKRTGTGGDAREMVLKFARSAGATGHDLQVVAPPSKDHERAFVRFTVEDREWLAAFLLIGQAGVLATSNCRSGDAKAFALGETVVASIGPILKKGLFRRK